MKKLLLGMSILCMGATFFKDFQSIEFSAPNAEPVSANAITSVTNTEDVANVVTKALAFKALLTTTQQATLQQTFTATLAKKWSNLPCGSSCRNGIQFANLTAVQLTAALEVIEAAAGATTNEGYSEFLQIRAAEEQLQATAGGNNYDEGIYFLSFLNTPSTTGAWMLQYGGHHYAANIAFNGGVVTGVTPLFEGVEPKSWTSGSTTYAPLAEEHDGFTAMLASLTATQLATAKLTSTFSDVVLGPNQDGNFPATKVGVQVSTLTAAQQALVLAAMQPYLNDVDATSAATLNSIYSTELAGTYVGWTGSGTAGNASTFLTANTNYVRIDGPSVWIEFVCQTGVVFPAQIHYHSVFRDHTRDYGNYLSNTALSVKDFGKTSNEIKLYPNPANSKITLSFNESLNGATIQVVDFAGRVVLVKSGLSGDQLPMDVSTLANGTYIVRVSSDSNAFSTKFIKK